MLLSAGYSGMSPRSNPQRSPHMHHPLSSPSINPLSPYPTPQHHPQQHPSSPYQSPRYESHQLKHPSPPDMTLPASSLSSTSVFQILPPRPYPAPYSSSQSSKSSVPHGSQLKSPRANVSQRSAPNSPQRFMMLPPQTAPGMSSARQLSGQTKVASGSGTKRRASSNAKAADQETREIMRKVSHSAIERRRRERINDKILQLKHLVPACVDEDHLHKLSILQSTIESVVPESVANARFQKATNSNPNNKTTDMLDAIINNQSTTAFAPMMTTGLGHPYSKRSRTDQEPGLQQSTIRSGAPSSGSTTSAQDSKRVTSNRPTFDEDAKDGLLLLSQISSKAKSGNASPSLEPTPASKKRLSEDAEEDEVNRDAEDDVSDASDDLDDDLDDEDDEYAEGEMMDGGATEDAIDIKTPTHRSSNNDKMSMKQLLC
ncbi:hypothetical protein BGZ98_006791 [Dissophora globulifera]|nr:hypothetical protein BGZ98_006791 [Dissophora globulifera]